MEIKAMFDNATSTLTYVVYDKKSLDAVIIDPVLDFDPCATSISFQSIEKVVEFVKKENLKIHYIFETHAHADHLSGAKILADKYYPDSKIAIGKEITQVQETFKPVFGFDDDFKEDGSQFDLLLSEGDVIKAGSLEFKVLSTPGHTPSCVSYLIKDAVFTGDALFMPDSGTGRCDFPLGSSKDLFNSVSGKIYELPEDIRIFVGHDYQPENRELRYETTVKESMYSNKILKSTTSEDEFIKVRDDRDKALAAPKLLYPSIQVNIAAGGIHKEKTTNRLMLKLPVTIN